MEVVLKNRRTILERIEKYISPHYFTDVNLKGRLYPHTSPVTSLTHYAAPGRITYSEATQGEYSPTSVGSSFGPAFATHWFRVVIDVPSDWLGREVHFRWNSGSEAMIWKAGNVVQAFSGDQREDFILSQNLQNSELHYELYVEMACNTEFGAGGGGMINPPDVHAQFTLSRADLAVFDRNVYDLLVDLEILHDMCKHLPENSHRAYQALYTANDIINICVQNPCTESFKRGHEIAESFFSQGNGASQHTVCAVGHCHIDSAWLWPYAETIRKCARSWSTTIRLMERYPQFTFACSQAQQFQWVKEHYPDLYKDITHFVKKGRFIPVGGVWVEMDGNLPSGEAFVRQFLYGQRFFEQEFGMKCQEFWLPDTFGYSGQLPQVMKQCGISRFLTQKLSWNLVNKFPHHTFWWEGIDGSRVLSHFPPGENYGMKGKVEELLKTVNNFEDKGRSNYSMYLYGYGDGGQGPTEHMIEALTRLADTDGLPRVEMSCPDDYFSRVEQQESDSLCKWVGELYFELHNGTYTTQAKTKRNNRQCEFLLRNLELIASLCLAAGNTSFMYPHNELQRLWKLLLLNQFHDVLPGSSIGEVYKDAIKYYKDIRTSGTDLLKNAVEHVINTSEETKNTVSEVCMVFNTLSWTRKEVIAIATSDQVTSPASKRLKGENLQVDSKGDTLAYVESPGIGYSIIEKMCDQFQHVSIEKRRDECLYLSNEFISAVIDPAGRILSLTLQGHTKNAIADDKLGNQFTLFDDVPLFWDAWDVMDYHLQTRKAVDEGIQFAKVVDEGPLRATVEVSLKISDKSYIRQEIILDAGCPYLKFYTEVHWHEDHKFLKVEFPLNVRSMQATYDIQFGHLQRTTHYNTSHDWAQFEVCGHKWADMSEYNWGVAILNDCKYGWSTVDNTLYLSLLRSPKAPDAKADMGVHRFTYAVMPHTGSFQDAGVIQQAYALNCPLSLHHLTMAEGNSSGKEYVTVDTPAVIVEALKKSEDHDNALVMRLYEAYGGQPTANIKLGFPVEQAYLCNLLEEPGEEIEICDGCVTLYFRPFQIASLMLCLPKNES